jgi:hypothetical protein
VAIEFHPYEFHIDGEQPFSSDERSFLYPGSLEDACWEAFIGFAVNAAASEDWDVRYEPISNRCEHLTLPYPARGVLIKMRVLQLSDALVTLLFEHYPDSPDDAVPCVRTETTIACVRMFQTRKLPTEWPQPVRDRLNALEVATRGVAGARRMGLLHRIRSRFAFPRVDR